MKTMVALPLLALVFCFWMPPVRGADKDDGDLSQGEQNRRALEEYLRVDAELTKVFQEQVQAEKSPALREALIAAQRAWRTFCEAEGHYESVSGEGGSARSYYVNKRMTWLTRQRLYQIKTPFAAGWIEPAVPVGK